jgi:NikR C terminal nickel binding domain
VSLREPGRNLQIQSTAPLNVSGSHFRTRRAKPQRPLCPDETCMEVTALKDQAETCRHFADRTIAERGVRYGRVATTPTSAKTKRHPKAYLAIETPVVACPFRVISGKAQNEQMFSGLRPKADLGSAPQPSINNTGDGLIGFSRRSRLHANEESE